MPPDDQDAENNRLIRQYLDQRRAGGCLRSEIIRIVVEMHRITQAVMDRPLRPELLPLDMIPDEPWPLAESVRARGFGDITP